MEYKKRSKRRTINEYRQVKDAYYKHPESSPKTNKYHRFFEDVKGLCRSHGNDQEVGGAVRRLILKLREDV